MLYKTYFFRHIAEKLFFLFILYLNSKIILKNYRFKKDILLKTLVNEIILYIHHLFILFVDII